MPCIPRSQVWPKCQILRAVLDVSVLNTTHKNNLGGVLLIFYGDNKFGWTKRKSVSFVKGSCVCVHVISIDFLGGSCDFVLCDC